MQVPMVQGSLQAWVQMGMGMRMEMGIEMGKPMVQGRPRAWMRMQMA